MKHSAIATRATRALVTAFLWAGALAAADIRVDPGASGANNGTSWANARTSLTAALAAAVSGDRIWVKAGTYRLSGARTASFELKSGVSLYGGFAGSETALAARDGTVNQTILCGDILGDDPAYGASFTFANTGDNAYHVVRGAKDARLDGVIVRGGNANYQPTGMSDPNLPRCVGGGILTGTDAELIAMVKYGTAVSGGMTIENCTIENNSCEAQGGGLFLLRPADVVRSSTVRFNRMFRVVGTGGGGGVYCYGAATIETCVVQGNSTGPAPGNSQDWVGRGGGIYVDDSTNVKISNVVFSGNDADTMGGGLYVEGSSISTMVSNSVFVGNRSETGGAIGAYRSSGTSGGTPQAIDVRFCTFTGNQAGVFNGSGSSNSAGGAIFASDVDLTMRSNILSGNTAATGPQITMQQEYRTTTLRVSYTVLEGGTAGVGLWQYMTAPTPTIVTSGGIVTTAPTFVNAGNPAGTDAVLGTHDDGLALQGASAGIDGGTNLDGVNYDLLGFARSVGAAPDCGAYEYSSSPQVRLSAPAQVGQSFAMQAAFSESVTGFVAGDVGVANGVVSGFSGSGASYSWTVTPSLEGTVTVTVGAGVAVDGSANGNLAATPLVRIADFPPTVTLTSLASDPTKAAFTVTATFDEAPGTSFALGDIEVGNGTVSALAGSALTRTFTITPAAQGPVTVVIPAGSFANPNSVASIADSNTFSTTFDSVKPTPVITSPASATVAGAFAITMTWPEPVFGFAAVDLTLTNATLSGFAGAEGDTVFTATVTPVAAGAVKVALVAGKATDAAGNASNAALTLARNSEQSRPTVVLSSTATAVTKASPITVTATFNEPVTGLAAGDLVLVNASAAVSTIDGKVWTLQLTPVGDGTVSVQVPADVASDLAGNLNQASASLSRVSDRTGPGMTLTTGAGDPTAGSFVVTITADEAVTGLLVGDLVVTNGTAASLVGSGTSYTCTIRPSAAGLVTVNLPAGAVVDVAGNLSTAASALQRTVTVANDAFADAISISGWKGSTFGANFGATAQPGEPAHAALAAASSVWWTWTAPETGSMTIDTLGSLIDTQLAVYTGSDVAALSPVASNANVSSGVLQSKVTFSATEGTTYRIAIDGKAGIKGLITLNWALIAGNNTFATARAITASGSDSSGTWNATRDTGENIFGGIGAGQTVWWAYTAPANGTLHLSTEFSTIDSVLGVATGTAVSALTVRALDDDVPGDIYAEVGLKVTAGTVYRIMVDASAAAATRNGAVTLTWTFASGGG